MFSAVTSDGRLIQLAGSYSKEKAAELRKKRWFCPVCKSELDIKLGREKLPHFAHKKSRLCPGDSEPESEYHLEGKRQLFLWLKTQGCSVSLEPYLTSAGQRPDLTAESGEERLAFEFQCANLSADSLKSRTAGLKNAGYRPVWIIGAKRLKRMAAQFFRLSAFHWQFFEVHSFSSLMFYCPDARSFYRLHSITPFLHRLFLCRLNHNPSSQSKPERHLSSGRAAQRQTSLVGTCRSRLPQQKRAVFI